MKLSNEILWSRYEANLDLYKYYFSTSLKIVAFFLAITGAIVSFYFANTSISKIQLSLAFIVLIGIAIVVLFVFGIRTIGWVEKDLAVIAKELGMPIRITIGAIVVLWIGSIILISVTSAAMIYLICTHS